jgi:hypothetical protein
VSLLDNQSRRAWFTSRRRGYPRAAFIQAKFSIDQHSVRFWRERPFTDEKSDKPA